MSDYNSFQESFSTFILSASGFRKVFAADGDEESTASAISVEDAAAIAIIADVFSSLIKAEGGKTIAVGMDARPTGPDIAKVIIGALEALGFTVLYAGISAAPELMAWVKTSDNIDGFAYISASHNPIGHNGFKFGFSNGAVLGGDTAKKFISGVIAAAVDEDMYNKYEAANSANLPDPASNKKQAEDAYRTFSNKVITTASEESTQKPIMERIRAVASGIGIIAELNGSARGVSIDKDYFHSFGIKSRFLNDKPGEVVHRIVPEGSSLDLCREELEKAHDKDRAFILGYVPDNDGDRGNIVYINDKSGRAEILEAQEVFALSVKSELEFMKQLKPDIKLAVVVNGPTSMRIERIAEQYDAEVLRAEVGEANVVNLAAEKRTEGFEVRILGEGSNGGNITHPATVRDPLNTIFALIKLIAFGGFSSITEAVEALPAFTTTSAFEPEAKMQIGSISHAELKAAYEELFAGAFESKKDWLKSFGITGWYEINYEGTMAKTGIGAEFRSGRETGGLKIMLTGDGGKEIAYLWMRGSGTEPVFRVMTDIEGVNPKAMRALLAWQRELVAKAAGS
jgi:phosphomannomutase